MLRRPWFVLLPLLLLVATPAFAKDPNPEEASDLTLWSDGDYLRDELAIAVLAVAKAEKLPFPKAPTIEVSTKVEMEKLLEVELGETYRRLGYEKAQLEATFRVLAAGLVMKYEPARNVIHVLPQNVERITELMKKPELASRDMLRITLVHEAAHALDFQVYPKLDEHRRSRTTGEGLQAAGAVIEGHAQFVAAKVAKALKLEAAFDQLVELMASAPPTDDPATKVMMDVLIAESRFAYVGGHRFFDAVFAARGEEGVRAVMSNPPDHVRLIERPELYLEPSKDTFELDTEAVVAPLKAWNDETGRTYQEFPFKRAQLDAVFQPIPATETAAMRKAFKQGWGAVTMRTGQADMIAAILMEFDSADAAQEYLKQAKALLQKKDEMFKTGPIQVVDAKYEDGAGPDGSLPGLVCLKTMKVHGTETKIVVHNTTVGRFALDVTCMDDTIERKVQDTLLLATVKAVQAQLEGAAGSPKDAAALKALVADFRAAQMQRDEAALKRLGRELLPTSADLKSICREGEAATAFLAAYKGPRQEQVLTQDGADLEIGRRAFDPGDAARTEVHVHAATTEEIAAYAEGTAAYAEFPGGMRRFAERVAEPGRTWYVVELLEPGKDAGMKYTCFTKVGQRFVIVIKPWRAIPRDEK